MIKKLGMLLLAITALVAARMIFLALESQETKPKVGLEAGKLTYCPQKPNCVSSQEEGDHYIDPIHTGLSMEEIKERVLKLPNARLESEGENYAHLTFKSDLFGFLDDVELYKDKGKDDGVLHIRSASRVGYSDMDANRKRVEKIRKLLNK